MRKQKQISFMVDEDTAKLLAELQKDLKAPTNAAVFRKAIALTKLAVDQAKGSQGIVELRGRAQTPEQAVNVALTA